MNFKTTSSVLLIISLLLINNCTTKKVDESSPLSNPESQLIKETENNKSNVTKPPEKNINKTTNNDNKQENDWQFLLDNHQNEINKLQAEIKLLKETIDDISAYKTIWTDPLSIYDKKIIMKNGSSVFGNIIFQDDTILQIETLIGTLNINKTDIARIIDSNINIIDQEEISIADVNIIKNHNKNNNFSEYPNSAKVVLSGDFQEKQDENYNTILSGTVKNIGIQQANFVKINFTIYKDIKTTSSVANYTVFINGATQGFEDNIISHSSLAQNGIGTFELIIPSDFGPFTSYTYTIDWEQ